MKLTKLFVAAVVLLAAAGAAFADEAKYNELLAKGKDYEAKKQWVYAMGTYWDAILEYPQGAKDANDGFNRIRAGFAEYNESAREFIGTGNPGPGEYDIFSCYDGWINVCKEFEVYWNEHSDEIYYVPDVECEKGEADMKSRTMTYKFKGTLAFTPKFSTIWHCIGDSFRKAYRDNLDDIPAQWPAVSMFKDSKTIPVVKFISACNDKAADPRRDRTYKVETRSLIDLYKYTVIGGGYRERSKVDFPPYERKTYYVAAWNNARAIAAPDTSLSNLEIKIKILDKNGRIIGSNDSSGSLYFEISGISSDGMKILDSGEWSYKVESIVIKSKNVSAEIKKPVYRTNEEIKFDSVKYTAGPVINMYRKGNHTDALVEYEAAPFAKGLCNNYRMDKSIQKILRNYNQRNYYGYFCSEDTVDGEVFVLPLTGKNELVQKLGYAGDVPANISVETTIRFGKEEFKSDDFFELMNKMYNAEFKLGYNPAAKEYCIYTTTPAEIIATLKKAEEERIAAERKAEEERIAAEKKAEGERIAAEKAAEEEQRMAKKIENRGFKGDTSLTSVTIPSSVTSINSDAFYGCTSLTSVTIPDSVTSISSSAFSGCTSLKEIHFTGTKAHWMALYRTTVVVHCSDGDVNKNLYESITDIVIPNGVTSISQRAFMDCKSLTSVTIPSSVTSIDSDAFYGCTSLTSVTIPDGVTTIGGGAFMDCTSLTSVTIPDSVTTIGGGAFLNCTSLTNVTIPDSVKTIGNGAFKNCTLLKTVYYAGSKKDWKEIKIDNKDKGNKPLLKAEIIYGKK